MKTVAVWEFVSIGSCTSEDEIRTRCSLPLSHMHYLKHWEFDTGAKQLQASLYVLRPREL